MLLFSLEPMAGRLLLPRFGGAFHVWTTALMFFQGALFAGYCYAHFAADRLGRWHLLIVALPLAALPIGLGDAPSSEATVFAILGLLARHLALPFVVLSTTAVVAQRWLSRTGEEPWSLYAASNAGSLGALLGYALIIEPFVGLELQRRAWSALFVVYVLASALAWRASRRGSSPAPPPRSEGRPPLPRLVYWALLSAAPSAFLGAVTNLIALDIGSIPLVWVVPLAIYLGSFVVAFARAKSGEATRVPGFVRRLWPHVAAVGLFFFTGGDAGGLADAAVHLVVLAFVCLAAHGELYRARPEPAELTRYYLVVALGGWIGGAFVALLAPALFRGLYEYPVALVALALTIGIGRRSALYGWLRGPRAPLLASAALVLVIVLKIAWATVAEPERGETLVIERSHYGLYRVTRTRREDGAVRDLVSGTTRHGRQREGDPTPLSYYHPEGPLGDALALLERPRSVGVVGLGVGAAAGHLEAGERVRFFEIDPVVDALARREFTYLADARAEVDVVIGDARVSLERESRRGAPRYDLLLVDAFAGDAIPTHLLTVEALDVYLSRLAEDGVLLLHVSNRYYELAPVVAANARERALAFRRIARIEGLALDEDPSQYVAIARRPERLAPLEGWREPEARAIAPWTDDHVNVLEALLR